MELLVLIFTYQNFHLETWEMDLWYCQKLKMQISIVKNKSKERLWVGDSVCDTDTMIGDKKREDKSKTIRDHASLDIGKVGYYWEE